MNVPSYPLCTGAIHADRITHDGDTCPLHEAPDAHVVYAVLDTIHGPHRVRVSNLLTWDQAVDLHERLHELSRDAYGALRTTGARKVSYPGYTCYGRPVRHFCVRSAVDPAWPATAPVLRVSAV